MVFCIILGKSKEKTTIVNIITTPPGLKTTCSIEIDSLQQYMQNLWYTSLTKQSDTFDVSDLTPRNILINLHATDQACEGITTNIIIVVKDTIFLFPALLPGLVEF